MFNWLKKLFKKHRCRYDNEELMEWVKKKRKSVACMDCGKKLQA